MTPTLKLGHSRKHKATESGESDRYHKRATCKLELSGTDSTVEPEHTDEEDPLDLAYGANTHNYSETSFPYSSKIVAQFIISIKFNEKV